MVGSGMTTTMDLSATMSALAVASGVKNAYGYPKQDVVPPAVIVDYPDRWDFDVTFGVSNADATYPVYYIVGKVIESTTAQKVSVALLALKTALEAANLVIRVESATFPTVTIANIDYKAIRLDCRVLS